MQGLSKSHPSYYYSSPIVLNYRVLMGFGALKLQSAGMILIAPKEFCYSL